MRRTRRKNLKVGAFTAGLLAWVAMLACVYFAPACGRANAGAGGTALRLYHGAPPVVPHRVDEIGRRNCQSCHARGYARSNGRRAPITPHPERVNCRQCHVENTGADLFTANEFGKSKAGPGGNNHFVKANPLGPPYIPHRLQDRENCVVCHLSETASPDIRPRHGPRVNCRQCHVPLDARAKAFASSGTPVSGK